ncbi:hypothetical protein [Plantactinospora sp. B5E13]|uniref:hypothetical protein n=1 Tax=Plantactinospora sp. B5E13 TaxID=3153758 RepID=UPI00325E5B49
MFPTLQYTDFHKFLVSVGGLAVGVGVGLPVLLLRSQSVLKTTQAELQALPPGSRSAIQLQQEQMILLLRSWPYVSSALTAIGLALIIWGAVAWKKQQSRTDSRELAELAKLETDREKAYQETLLLLREHQENPEIAQKRREEEAAESLVPDSEEATDSPMSTGSVHLANEEATEEIQADTPVPTANIRNYLSGERLQEITKSSVMHVMNALAAAYGPDVDVTPDVRLGDSFADAVLTSRLRTVPNMIIDIKHLPSRPANIRHQIHDAIVWGLKVRAQAKKELRAPFAPVTFLIVDAPAHGQLVLFGASPVPTAVRRVAKVSTQILEEMGNIELPLNVVVAATESITPKTLWKIGWRTEGHPGVITL